MINQSRYRLPILLVWVAVLIAPINSTAQTQVSLEECLAAAYTNDARYQKTSHYLEIGKLKQEQARKGKLPQIALSAQATYQSEVTRFPLELPGVEIDPISRDQYQITADLYQPLYDGGRVRSQEQLEEIKTEFSMAQLETQLYQVRDVIIQSYYQILQLDEQVAQIEITRSTLESQYSKSKAAVENGVALPNVRDALEIELLEIDKRISVLNSHRAVAIQRLQSLTNMNLSDLSEFQFPGFIPTRNQAPENLRPELALFEKQRSLIAKKQVIADANVQPTIGVMARIGYGKPGLNFLENEFSPFYVAGLQFKWNLSSRYTSKAQRQINMLESQQVTADESHFHRMQNIQFDQFIVDLERLETLIAKDREILLIRQKMTKRAAVQLENQVITVSDYIQELNREELTRIRIQEYQIDQSRIQYQIKNLFATNS